MGGDEGGRTGVRRTKTKDTKFSVPINERLSGQPNLNPSLLLSALASLTHLKPLPDIHATQGILTPPTLVVTFPSSLLLLLSLRGKLAAGGVEDGLDGEGGRGREREGGRVRYVVSRQELTSITRRTCVPDGRGNGEE